MNINFCKEIFAKLCEEYNYPVPVIKENGRLKTTLGRVKYKALHGQVYDVSVEFSKTFITTSSQEDIRQVVMHEFVHYYLLFKDFEHCGHTPQFRAMCKKIGCTHTRARNGSTTIFKDTKALRDNGYKYAIKCSKCGKVLGYYKTVCKAVRQPDLYISTCCKEKCIIEKL